MAPNRKSKLEASVGSSEEEEGSSEENEEQEESESEEEEDKTSPPTPPKDKKPSALKKPEITQTSARTQSSSYEDSDSESDSASDSHLLRSRRSNPNIKPIASKPMEEPPIATKKARSKPSSASATPVKPSTSAKRPIDSDNNRDVEESKRAKKKALDAEDIVIEEDAAKKTGDDTKKQLFQRLWSEDDEIAVLVGMIEYTGKKGADPVADMNAFHDFIKNKLHIDVSKTQLSDKVRRLKKKYENNASKGKKGGERTLSKPHEQQAYELSKKIWGGEANVVGVDSTKVNGKEKKNQNQRSKGAASPKVDKPSGLDGSKVVSKLEVEQNATLPWLVWRNRSIGDSSLEEEIIRDGLELIEGTKRPELEEKWKQLRRLNHRDIKVLLSSV
ncbi:hypothetical protein F0562_018941 [Nyssa sinensis]|uniref:Glabrous enhancer-binding protein-like DBD domain-containing protein n=1 Tax=Nyssa sinensis TaxID=561372 RepID=A0A5J4ZCZ6_9ASTE|nr:hypothetical protein F0562_018941 [Nyssa sinensis]